MPDIFTKKKRSEIMSCVKGKNTKVELLAFKYLRSRKIYFQKHYSRIVGKPDIAVPSHKKAIFIDGDFWHGRDFEAVKNKLTPYWRNKIAKNILRDKRNRILIKKQGWLIMRIWESALLKSKDKNLEKIAFFLTANRENGSIYENNFIKSRRNLF